MRLTELSLIAIVKDGLPLGAFSGRGGPNARQGCDISLRNTRKPFSSRQFRCPGVKTSCTL